MLRTLTLCCWGLLFEVRSIVISVTKSCWISSWISWDIFHGLKLFSIGRKSGLSYEAGVGGVEWPRGRTARKGDIKPWILKFSLLICNTSYSYFLDWPYWTVLYWCGLNHSFRYVGIRMASWFKNNSSFRIFYVRKGIHFTVQSFCCEQRLDLI